MNKIYQPQDDELICSYLKGNSEALTTLIYRYKDKIFTTILLLVKDKNLAEDIFQETFIRIINTLREGKYNEEGKFLPWASRIAHNLCLSHFRSISRKPRIVNNDRDELFETSENAELGSDEKMFNEQSKKNVLKLLDLLPTDQKEVIILRHYTKMSFKEIAQMTNTNINTVLGKMRYGLINMRKLMAEKQIEL